MTNIFTLNSRWIRLIFTRELPFSVAMRLWDGIFAEDPGLQLLDYICIAMLLLVRNECELGLKPGRASII